MIIDLLKLIKNQYTYPNWSTSTQYKLETKIIDKNKILIYYKITKSIINRKKERLFPRYIHLTPKLSWMLGFFKAEGVSSIRSRSYYRFSITNKNPFYLKGFIEEMNNSGLLPKNKIKGKCLQIHHYLRKPDEVIDYWSNKLKFPADMFTATYYDHNLKKSEYGVCHFDISDVLLRRVVDIISEKILIEKSSEEWI